jgi:hypothetical protein
MDQFVTELKARKEDIEQQRIENGTEARFSKLTNKNLPNF